MNKERRKAIESALATLAKARELVEEAQTAYYQGAVSGPEVVADHG